MKKLILIAAALPLGALAACQQSPQAQAIENNGAAAADALENQGDQLEAMADNTTNTQASEMMENQADASEKAADNVRAEADAKADNVNDRARR